MRNRGGTSSWLLYGLMNVACTERASLGVYGESSTGADDALTADPPADSASASTGNDAPARCPEGRDCGGSCPDSCGVLESPYDANGCVRPECSNDDQCGADERCFVAGEFGLCEPTGLICDRMGGDAGQCSCTDDGTCDGGHCVPEDLWPVEEDPGLGVMRLDFGCGPADGAALWIRSGGVPGMGCDGPVSGDPDLSLLFDVAGEPPYELVGQSSEEYGSYRGADGVVEDVWLARLHIDDLVGASASGTIEVYAPDAGTVRAFTIELVDVPVCGPGACP
ncbi:MAG: hypothetical protein IAG13_37105 [Deltaproteobacteria bacterium]|nr:hypothetical protein [Nannocystaceae bacterium]